MKKLLIIFLCIAFFSDSIAQIKMADETYKKELSTINKATEPISIETSFASYDGTFIYDYSSYNLVGETLYSNGCTIDNCIVVSDETRSISNTSSLPKGYYLVTDLFLCQDSGSQELADVIFAYVDKGYKQNIKIGSIAISDKSQFCDAISKTGRWLGGSISQNELKTLLNQNRLEGKTIKINSNRIKIVYCLSDTESSNKYYLPIPAWIEDRLLPISYFNFICEELKGRDVFMTYSGDKSQGTGFYRSAGAHKELKDALTDKIVYQRDTLFRCVDVIVDAKEDGSHMKVCCVLEGKNTGKVALNVVRCIESKDEDKYDDPNLLCYYKSSNDNWTIWQEAYNQKKEGTLFRGRHFDVAYPGGNNIIGYAYRRIVKVDDLASIFNDTKKHLVDAADHQKRVAARYYAWKTLRLYNLSQKYGEEYGSLISDHKVAIGMTPEMCKEAWGHPIRILTGQNELGDYKAWVYNFNRYIYFVNNKVVEILY